MKDGKQKVQDSFAYRPTASRGGMMKSGKEPEEDRLSEEELDEEAFRQLVRKEIRDLLQK